jgi:phosphate transport system substrate-binding protein
MKKHFLFLSALVAVGVAFAASTGTAAEHRTADTTLQGAGSTFVFPLVSQWVANYKPAKVSYNPIGSGGGIAAITNRNVDFGASDAPLTKDQFAACKGCVQIPWALSGTSAMYHLDGAPTRMRITGKILAAIYLGQITYWDDSRIKALNKDAKLPHEKITPIFRSDGSGTTFNWTDYLSSVSPEFRSKIGTSTQVNFPVGVGGKGSSGVSAVLAQTNGGIAYADVAYAVKNGFSFFRVQNKAGKFILPGNVAIAAAAATVKKVPSDNALSIVNPPKTQKIAYPISTFTWVIVPTTTSKAADLKKFILWAVGSGQSYGPRLRFVPVPKVVVAAAKRTVSKVHS